MMIRLNFTLTQLEYVLAVHRLGHFSKAAEACHVTQPTLSMQIQKLEEGLGATLFDRTKKPILLTPLGAKLVAQMQAVVGEARKMEGIVENERSGNTSGELVLGVIPTVTPYVIPWLLPLLRRMEPGLRLRIKEMQTQRIVEALQTDELDVGLLATPLGFKRINERPLFYETFSVLCQEGDELFRKKKVGYAEFKHLLKGGSRLWLMAEGHCLRNQVMDLCSYREIQSRRSASRRSREEEPVDPFEFESGSLETLKRLVESYGGYTLLPLLASRDIPASCRLIEFERPAPAREIGLVYLREHHRIEWIERLGKVILEGLPASIQKLKRGDLDVRDVQSEDSEKSRR